MGLSSDNMQTLKRLESLAGRPLSIMALAYVHSTTHHPQHALQVTNQHPEKHWQRLQNTCLETSPLCWNVDAITAIHSHTSSFCLKNTSAASFPFCLEKPWGRAIGTKETVTSWRAEHKSRVAMSLEVWLFEECTLKPLCFHLIVPNEIPPRWI